MAHPSPPPQAPPDQPLGAWVGAAFLTGMALLVDTSLAGLLAPRSLLLAAVMSALLGIAALCVWLAARSRGASTLNAIAATAATALGTGILLWIGLLALVVWLLPRMPALPW